MDIKALMDKKVAGIPVVYIAAVVMAVMLYAAIRMPKSTATEETEEEDIPAGDLPDTSQPVFSATPVINQPSGPNSVASTPQQDTNDLWARRSVEWLIANGTSYNLASTAIAKFLAGDPLTAEESGVKDRAIKQYGMPPEGLLTGSIITPDENSNVTYEPSPTAPLPPASAPASAQGVPPLSHTVKGTNDNNARELARIYYGRNDEEVQALIRAANHDKAERPGALATPGEKVRIPAYTPPKYYKATAATRTAQDIAAKNGTGAPKLRQLNPGMNFPVAVGVRVRVA